MALSDLPLLPAPPPGADAFAAAMPQGYGGAGISLTQVVAISRAYWKQSVAIALVVFLALAALAITKPKTYVATATLMINYQVNDPIAGKEFPLALLGNYMSTQMELIASPVVLLPVVDKLRLDQDRKYTDGARGDLEVLRNAAEKTAEENLTVNQGRFGSQLIFVTYKGYSGNDAADVANAIADVYTNREYQGDASPSERIQVYSQQIAELKKKVDDAQSALTDFYRRTGLISGDGTNDADAAALTNLEARLLEAQNTRRNAEVAANTGVGGLTAAGQSILPGLKQQLATQLQKMAELRQTDGPRHPQVLELQSQIDATNKAIADEERHSAISNSSDLGAARQVESKLKQAIAEQRAKIVSQAQMKEEREKLRLELESTQTMYRRAVDGYEEVKRSATSTYNNVSVLARAVPPTKANSRRTRVALAVALVAGSGIGLVLPLAYGFLVRRVRCRDDLERDFGIPVLVEFSQLPDNLAA